MNRKTFLLFFCTLLLSACVTMTTSKSTYYIAKYMTVLDAVECPADAKQQFGETKIVTSLEEGKAAYTYEDDFINITWFVGSKQLEFILTNKSGHSLKINWNDVSFVDIYGTTSRIIHAGIKFNERQNPQTPTTIPNGAKISDLILPINNIRYSYGLYGVGTWETDYLFPCVYKTKEGFNTETNLYIGKTMQVLLPIMIQNVQNDYVFTFKIHRLINSAK